MNRRFILRYLILIAVLAVCAGAAWYMTNTPGTHAADTVLARVGSRMGKYAVPQRDLVEETVMQRADSCVMQEKIPAGYGVLRRNVSPEYDAPGKNLEGGLL